MDRAGEGEGVPIWIDWENRIISFQHVDGYERLVYPTHDEMLAFAVERSMAGYAIR